MKTYKNYPVILILTVAVAVAFTAAHVEGDTSQDPVNTSEEYLRSTTERQLTTEESFQDHSGEFVSGYAINTIELEELAGSLENACVTECDSEKKAYQENHEHDHERDHMSNEEPLMPTGDALIYP